MWRLLSGSPSKAVRSQSELPRALVEGHHQPALAGTIRRGVPVAVKPLTEGRLGIAADGGRHKEAVAPHDRARMRESGHGRAPQDVLAARDVPGVRQVLADGDAGGLDAPKRRPASGRRRRWRQRSPHFARRANDAPIGPHHRRPNRHPGAAVEDHAPGLAGVGLQRQRQPHAVPAEGVAPRAFAALPAAGRAELQGAVAGGPLALEGRPALALEREAPVPSKRGREDTEGHRRIRQGLRLLRRAALADGGCTRRAQDRGSGADHHDARHCNDSDSHAHHFSRGSARP